MTDKASTFHSKILLFGEYSIIQDSMGLTVPYDIFKGSLTFEPMDGLDPDFVKQSNQNLQQFLTYLKEQIASGHLKLDFDDAAFEADINNGIYFHSNIPQGFGIGSSGALVAAVYDRYVRNKVSLEEVPTSDVITELKKVLGTMESFFHGKSSGVDPLICYLNLPLLIKGKEEIEPVQIAMKKNGQGAIFLIDTGIARKTEPLVKYYMQQMEKPTYREFVDKQLKPFANNCIQAFLEGDTETLFGYLKKLSHFQFKHFKPMIPSLFNKQWKQGLESGDYYLKLCGAGGGGFILGFTRDMDKTREQFKGQKLEVLSYI
jgi:mevalonate kinase